MSVKKIEYFHSSHAFTASCEVDAARLSESDAAELNALVQESGILAMTGQHGNLRGIYSIDLVIETTDGKRYENSFAGVVLTAGPFAKVHGLFKWLDAFAVRTKKK